MGAFLDHRPLQPNQRHRLTARRDEILASTRARWVTRGEILGPLRPAQAIKDLAPAKGADLGLAVFRNNIAADDAVFVARMRAGAIIIRKTNVRSSAWARRPSTPCSARRVIHMTSARHRAARAAAACRARVRMLPVADSATTAARCAIPLHSTTCSRCARPMAACRTSTRTRSFPVLAWSGRWRATFPTCRCCSRCSLATTPAVLRAQAHSLAVAPLDIEGQAHWLDQHFGGTSHLKAGVLGCAAKRCACWKPRLVVEDVTPDFDAEKVFRTGRRCAHG